MKTCRRPLIAFAITLSVALLGAQQQSPIDVELRRIFEAREYTPQSFGPIAWLDEGRRYTTVEPSASDPSAKDLIAYDSATGQRTVLISASALKPAGASASLEIEGYTWSSDKSRLLVFTSSARVWRQNTRGDFWVFEPATRKLAKLGGPNAAPSSLMFAKFSPDGSQVAYVRENNLYVEDLRRGSITPLTDDGSKTTINGTSDWVNEEEFDVRDGFRWSPDGRSIAFWEFDTTGVELFTLVNATDSLYPTLTRFPYPKAGTTNSAVRIGVVQASGGAPRWMKLPGDPRNTYVPRMDWASGSATLAMQQLNRLQNTNDLLLADVRTGNVTRSHRDESKTWVDVVDDLSWLEGGREYLWVSEKDGWQHVYRVAKDGSSDRLVTRFDGDVTSIAGVDRAGGWLYFIASPESAIERYLYRTKLDGSTAIERVTPKAQQGTHSYNVSPDHRWAFHTYSRFDVPAVTELVSLPDHRVVRTAVDNAALRTKVGRLIARPTEFFKVNVGAGVELDGWMLKPPAFDPARKYPLVMFVYGEPASQTVLDRWGGSQALFHRALANDGYVVASVDNRGTPAPRGTAWRKVVYGAVGDLSSKEQAAAVRALVAERPYLDANRVAIWGWSGGGTSTLNAMFRFPSVYKVGIAVAPVPDQKLYDTIYQERYMGLPQENADGYRRGSPMGFADGLQGRLMMVHGSGDDNVHFQGTERLVNRLIELGKPFDLMVYPNRTHAISEGAGTSVHVYSLIARYLREHM